MAWTHKDTLAAAETVRHIVDASPLLDVLRVPPPRVGPLDGGLIVDCIDCKCPTYGVCNNVDCPRAHHFSF